MKIYLAGDSLVQDYSDEEFIAGWGQYLKKYIRAPHEVINAAKGGRSSRLFINEGRFDAIDRQLQRNDYLLIEFCHNDDATKEYRTMYNRLTPLGKADENGIFPIIPGRLISKDQLPEEYVQSVMQDDTVTDKDALLHTRLQEIATYPHRQYYSYAGDGSCGTYKWFLKQFIDMARRHRATPILVTPPARAFFNGTGRILDAPGLHGGNRFAYVRAMKQLAEETDTPVIDLFSYAKELFEKNGPDRCKYLTSIKKGANTGKWPADYLNELKKATTVSEKTHLNKYGAFLMAQHIAASIAESNEPQLSALKSALIRDFSAVNEATPLD